jgi:hypothetical protein
MGIKRTLRLPIRHFVRIVDGDSKVPQHIAAEPTDH